MKQLKTTFFQGYGFDLEEASAQLRRHLKFRKFYDLDNSDQIPEHEILKKYFPIGLVGECSQPLVPYSRSTQIRNWESVERINFFPRRNGSGQHIAGDRVRRKDRFGGNSQVSAIVRLPYPEVSATRENVGRYE